MRFTTRAKLSIARIGLERSPLMLRFEVSVWCIWQGSSILESCQPKFFLIDREAVPRFAKQPRRSRASFVE